MDQLLLDLLVGHIDGIQSLDADLQRPQAFEQGLLEGASDGHDLSGALHLGAEVAVHGAELVEGPAGDLDDHVVDGRLEGGIGGAGDLVGDLVEGVSDGDLGGDAGDWISRGLGCQRGGPGHPRVDLDEPVVPVGRVERELDVASSLDAQLADDLERGGPEALVILVREGEAGSHDDALSCMDSHRVEVLHVAYDDAVVGGIAHDLVLVLLPAEDALLDQDLVDPRIGESAGADLPQLLLVVGDASAGSSEGVGGSDQYGVPAYDGDGLDGLLDGIDAARDGDGLSDALHRLLEQLPVLGLGDGLRLGSDEGAPELLQDALVGQLGADVQSGLTAHSGDYAVHALLLDDLPDMVGIERLYVHAVRGIGIGLDGGGIGVDENGAVALFTEGAARLRPGEIEFGGLTDDDRSGPNDHQFAVVLPHSFPSLTILPNLSNRNAESSGPADASGWYWDVKIGRSLCLTPSTVPSLTLNWSAYSPVPSRLF